MVDHSLVERLLVVCLEDACSHQELEPALRVLYQDLPGVSLSLLTSRPHPSSPPLAEVLSYCPGEQSVLDLVDAVRLCRFDAALILTRPGHSPYLPAYACYLAGVRWRFGQSLEFGGGVLSHRLAPEPDLTLLARRAAREMLRASDEPA